MKEEIQKKAAIKLLQALAKDPEGILADAKMISFTILKEIPEGLKHDDHDGDEEEEEEVEVKEKKTVKKDDDPDTDNRPPWLKKKEIEVEEEEED